MTTGLLVGVVLSALTFVLQTTHYVNPIRRRFRANNLRSNVLRSPLDTALIASQLNGVMIIQLHSTIFFANATGLARELEEVLDQFHVPDGGFGSRIHFDSSGVGGNGNSNYNDNDNGNGNGISSFDSTNGETHYNATQPLSNGNSSEMENRIRSNITIVVLDFTLVLGIDSSAAEIIADLAKLCKSKNVRIVFVRGSPDGFPCAVSLSERLQKQEKGSPAGEKAYRKKRGGDSTKARTPIGATNSSSSVFLPSQQLGLGLELRALEEARHPQTSLDDGGGDHHTPLKLKQQRQQQQQPQQQQQQAPTENNSPLKRRNSTPVAVAPPVHSTYSGMMAHSPIYVADDLNEAILWVEEALLECADGGQYWPRRKLQHGDSNLTAFTDYSWSELQAKSARTERLLQSRPLHLRQLQLLCFEDEDETRLDLLMSHFQSARLAKGETLWAQGSEGDSAVVVVSGELLSYEEGEEEHHCCPVVVGEIIGDDSMINRMNNPTTVVARVPTEVLRISRSAYRHLEKEDPVSAIAFCKLSLAYSHLRANRVHHKVYGLLGQGL
jgi:hypothetical protein